MERLIRQRLHNHKLPQSELREPAAIVSWFGAMQAQDFAGAKWAIGQRANGLTDTAIEQAYNAGAILRTHVLRPTWHFVTPVDIGWMLTLTAPRVQQFSAYAYRQFELDSSTLSRARSLLTRALEGGDHLTRAELAAALKRGRIVASGPRLGLLTIDAELNQIMCSGAMRGRQFTYARFDSRAARAPTRSREDALAELTRRYFSSHGPATLKDFAWWSGLTMTDVRAGVEMLKPHIVRERIDDLEYFSVHSGAAAPRRSASVSLLPTFDEYLIAYKDRGIVVRAAHPPRQDAYTSHLVMDGRLAGSWRPTAARTEVTLNVKWVIEPTAAHERALARAITRYGSFVEKTVRS